MTQVGHLLGLDTYPATPLCGASFRYTCANVDSETLGLVKYAHLFQVLCPVCDQHPLTLLTRLNAATL
jgi:hypothetical protein